ncbi:MAG: amidohydrolase family protein [Oscillospiraceae bacterium]|nr:amidohydrolase family protein [Oscillospiraceae bacterium]
MIVKKIDMHVHTSLKKSIPRAGGGNFTTADELLKMYDHLGIEKGVQLPDIGPECAYAIQTNEEAMDLTAAYPDKFYWFCNIDPRWGGNSPNTDLSYFIDYFKERGAKGVGEICVNLYFDDPLVDNLFRHCEMRGMPVIFHIGRMGNDYGLVDDAGLKRLERSLQKFPNLKFLGHSQKFWAEISGNCTEENRGGYPIGPVTPGGRVVELMRNYPNLYGDLSAGSGENAIMRDFEFGWKFLEEFQDRLFFGTDICDPGNKLVLSFHLDDAVESGHISQECYNKICRKNALALLT